MRVSGSVKAAATGFGGSVVCDVIPIAVGLRFRHHERRCRTLSLSPPAGLWRVWELATTSMLGTTDATGICETRGLKPRNCSQMPG